jgi:peptidoglycan/LPS O-acetylase OafA/YrhL
MAERPHHSGPRFPVLDALRFVLAFWVVMGHFGVFPIFFWVNQYSDWGRTLVHGWSSLVFGTPAVIGFFIISGFCIHLPFRNNEILPIGSYYARRYTRILLPLAACLLIWRYGGGKPLQFLSSVPMLMSTFMWSLICEEIYYAIYPLLREVRRRYGWTLLLVVTTSIGIGVSLTHFHAQNWAPYGPIGTSLILLPVWLLGCVLAEQSDTLTPSCSSRSIWKWRISIWAVSWIFEMMHFKLHISAMQTMLLFGALTFFWIRQELRYGMYSKPSRLLVFGGAWSYSLYLMHGAAFLILSNLVEFHVGPVLLWIAQFSFILAFSYAFYVCVERPSHRLARRIPLVRRPSHGVSLRPDARVRSA